MPSPVQLLVVGTVFTVLAVSVLALGLGLGLGLGLNSSSSPSSSGGGGSGGSGGQAITTFSIVNTANVGTLGYKRIGLVFKDGDLPEGWRIRIQRNDTVLVAQFDNRSYYQSGSLRVCTATFRDEDFAANETRTYSVAGEEGAFDNGSGATLSDVTGASDFKVEFTSIVGSTSGPIGNLEASFNTHAAVSTRVTKYESGKVCDSWMVWGMAGNHSHLKTIWYVTQWKAHGDSVRVALEVAAVVSQDWWSVAEKEKLNYTATLKDGVSTIIETYSGVEHLYMMQWATVRLQEDDQHATRHWIGAGSKPTLLYKPDRTYWIASGMVPPINLTTVYKMPTYKDTYVPGSSFSHRPGIPSTGGYMGRGLIPNVDSIAFATQTAADVRTSRVNNFAGLLVPAHGAAATGYAYAPAMPPLTRPTRLSPTSSGTNVVALGP